FPIFVPLSRNSHSQFGFQILKAVKAKVDVLSFYGGLRFTSIDTGSVDISTCLMGFVDIDFSLIKASIVVQHGNHELQRIVGLQVKALVTFHSKPGTVRLVEGIPRKAFHLPPDLLGNVLRIAGRFAVVKELVMDLL